MSQKRANSEGSIYQKKDGRWQVSLTIGFDENGKQIRKSATAHTQKEALIKLDNLRRQYRDGGPQLKDFYHHDPLVADFVDSWLDLVRPQLEPATQERYTKDCGYLKKYLGNLYLRNIDPLKVSQMYTRMAEDGFSSAARKQAGARLRQLLKKAVELKLLNASAAHAVKLPKYSPKEIHPLTQDQARALLIAAAGDRLQALYHLALDTGARKGELFALEWADFDQAHQTIRIVKSLEELKNGQLRVKDTKTRASRRTLRLGQWAYEALLAHRTRQEAEGQDSPLIFPDATGGHLRGPNVARRSFLPLLSRASLPRIRFHDLRHTTATLMLLAGIDIKTVAARLGHGTTDMLLRTYAHVLPEHEDRGARAINAMLRSSTVAASGAESAKPGQPEKVITPFTFLG